MKRIFKWAVYVFIGILLITIYRNVSYHQEMKRYYYLTREYGALATRPFPPPMLYDMLINNYLENNNITIEEFYGYKE